MDRTTLWIRLAVAGAMTVPFAPPVLAGGQVPIPPESRTYASHAACFAALEAIQAKDRGRIAPRTVAANGDTREVSLVTPGIERTGPGAAGYEATLWYHNGRLRPDLQQVETAHSFERRAYRCEGAVMTTTGEAGFTLNTFEPPQAR